MNFVTEFDNMSDVDFIEFLFMKKSILDKNLNQSNIVGIFDDFEVVYIELKLPFGSTYKVDTRTINSFGENKYVEWFKIKESVRQYIYQTSSITLLSKNLNLNLHIRLRASKEIYEKIDIGQFKEYNYFDVTFYLGEGLRMVSTSSIEKKIPVIFVEPQIRWDQMIKQNIEDWKYEISKKETK